MSHLPAPPPPRYLSLPEEFVLLSHLNSGKVHGSARAVIGCAAAELGELALRRKLLVRPRKSKVFGHDVYRLHGVRIELLDTGRTGLEWADEVLGKLKERSVSATDGGHVSLNWWFRRRHEAFHAHRAALAERGALLHKPGRFLAGERHYPHQVSRDALIAEIRAASGEQIPLDEHMLYLWDLVEAVGLSRGFGSTARMRQQLDRSRGTGPVGDLPEDVRDSSKALSSAVPTDNSAQYGRPRL